MIIRERPPHQRPSFFYVNVFGHFFMKQFLINRFDKIIAPCTPYPASHSFPPSPLAIFPGVPE
ncbi:MAG: hypothetical protein A2V64_10200 [Bacteroidetes bacterium RBG_13_43_22]|nr:MAG: hypothetical protein A2V64_10200 [Bacteroidetes bacterium RBG_13_43_22]